MSSQQPGLRPVRLPAADLNEKRIPVTHLPRRKWHRVHQSAYPAKFFSLNTNHRFSHPQCPYPFLYLGADPATCFFERFGDILYDHKLAIANALWRAHGISAMDVPPLPVCDLTNARTLSALNVDLAALMSNRLSIPQEWGCAIQTHPANFRGIKFKSHFNNGFCLAIICRDEIEKRIKEKFIDALPANDAAADWLHDHRVSLY